MKKYLVGGAVRNTLLNIPIKEKDWVITGSTPQEMINIGYEQVGKSFPVFLHPKNHEEYALARTEKKYGTGHTGFIFYTHPSITIEEDLYRRDLTINAMAYDIYGNLIDPYHGKKDIQSRLLKHVSHAFIEDPLRVLRVARFSAQLAHMRFTIYPATLKLMQKMIYELSSLSPERIWTETKKALMTDSPHIYFQVLYRCGALKILFPELYILFKIPLKTLSQNNSTHISIGCYTMMILSKATRFTKDPATIFSILYHKINTRIISQHQWTKKYINYDLQNTTIINNLCSRLKLPNEICSLTQNVSKYHKYLYDIKTITPRKLMMLFQDFNCWHDPKKIEKIILINKIITSHQKNNKNFYYSQKNFLYTAFMLTKKINAQNVINDGFTKSNISQELYRRRLHAIYLWQKNIFINYNK